MKKTTTIPWAPLSKKHVDYINNALHNRMNVAEGAIRSGKTIDHCIIAAQYLEICPDKIHLASGSTIGNAKLNIGVCNGFGLENLFRGRCRWGKYKQNEALFISTQTGEKVVIFTGGAKSDSYKRILGNSYGLWIATEINEHYDSEDSRESFIKVANGRQVAAQWPLTLWDLNPCSPHHTIYEWYIDSYKENGLVGGYQYEHFTIKDNLSISPQRIEEIKSQYSPGTVWYRRDILGERCVAEGLIYHSGEPGVFLFADDPDKYTIGDPIEWAAQNNTRFSTVCIGVDFGGTGSATKFQATGITGDGVVVALDEEYIKTDIDPDALNKRYTAFARKVIQTYGGCYTRADSAEQILIRGLVTAAANARLQTTVKNALKLPIKDRIELTLLLMAQGRLFVSDKCPHLIDAFETAVYDPKHTDERLDDGTSDIDSLDAFEYSIEPWFKTMTR